MSRCYLDMCTRYLAVCTRNLTVCTCNLTVCTCYLLSVYTLPVPNYVYTLNSLLFMLCVNFT